MGVGVSMGEVSNGKGCQMEGVSGGTNLHLETVSTGRRVSGETIHNNIYLREVHALRTPLYSGVCN